MNKNSQAKIKASNKYVEKTYERFTLRFKKGEQEKVKEHAESKGLSLNSYIIKLIEKDMKDE